MPGRTWTNRTRQRDAPIELAVLRLEDLTHAAGAEQALDLVVATDDAADRQDQLHVGGA